MKDQHTKPVPDDLVLLESSSEALRVSADIGCLDWYSIGRTGHIFVSDARLKRILVHDFISLEEAYPNTRPQDVFLIDNSSKRHTLRDGFYYV